MGIQVGESQCFVDLLLRLKRYLAILLFVCITAPVVGTYCWLSYEKHLTQKEVKRMLIRSIDKSELTVLSLSLEEAEEDLRWEHSKEFEYKGEMYDVVEKQETADSVTYWCWWDHEETALNKDLAKLVSDVLNHNPDRNTQTNHLIDFFKSLYYQPIENTSLMLANNDVEQYAELSLFKYLRYFSPSSPPPKPA